jgi:hypothetical protein
VIEHFARSDIDDLIDRAASALSVSGVEIQDVVDVMVEDGVDPGDAMLAAHAAAIMVRTREGLEPNVASKLCEHAKFLASYLNIEFDPYDFSGYVGLWPGVNQPPWESYEDVPEDRQDEFAEWITGTVIPRMMGSDPLSLPAYVFFRGAKTLPPGTWLVHFSPDSFLSFAKGATLETLALSKHVSPKNLKSCEANLDPDSGIHETVWGFALEARGLRHGQLREMSGNYGRGIMLFQTDCAVKAYHTDAGMDEVIFPLCSEYNVHRGTYQWPYLNFESTGGTDQEYESLSAVIDDIEAGKLVPNVVP